MRYAPVAPFPGGFRRLALVLLLGCLCLGLAGRGAPSAGPGLGDQRVLVLTSYGDGRPGVVALPAHLGQETRFVRQLINYDLEGTLHRAMELFPDTRQVLFVSGNTESDRAVLDQAVQVMAPWRGRVACTGTVGLTLEQVRARIKEPASGTIIMVLPFNRDGAGRTMVQMEVAFLVAAEAGAPVFTLWDNPVGKGAVGGSVTNFADVGAQGGEFALELMAGRRLLAAPVTDLPARYSPRFDWLQIKRWHGIPANLPKGSSFLNRPAALWEQYRRVVVAVEDDGLGMPPEVLAHVLEPFYTTKPVGKGTGLGLSMTYGVVKAHGGSIDIASEPGRGTSVRLRFPRIPVPGSAPLAGGPGPLPVAAAEALRVFLVDDDEDVRFLMVRMLTRAGVRWVKAFAGGEQVLEALATGEHPDLVILDQNMPGLNGAQTLERINALGLGLPILIASGQPDLEDWPCYSQPNVCVLAKPFGLEEILARLAGLGPGRS